MRLHNAVFARKPTLYHTWWLPLASPYPAHDSRPPSRIHISDVLGLAEVLETPSKATPDDPLLQPRSNTLDVREAMSDEVSAYSCSQLVFKLPLQIAQLMLHATDLLPLDLNVVLQLGERALKLPEMLGPPCDAIVVSGATAQPQFGD
jgi:hypothetical protein